VEVETAVGAVLLGGLCVTGRVEVKRDGVSGALSDHTGMINQERLPEIKFDEWAATPAGARRLLLVLREIAATADESLAWFESNPKKREDRAGQFRIEVEKMLEKLSALSSKAQSSALNQPDASLPDSVRRALLTMAKLGADANVIRQSLAGSGHTAASESAFHSSVSGLINSILAIADAVSPLYTLFAHLEDNLERAAEEYGRLHDDLTRRLDDWGSPMLDCHADLALDRVTRRIEEGVSPRDRRLAREEGRVVEEREVIGNLAHFSRAFAWNVWREYLAKAADGLPDETAEPEGPGVEVERRYECMRECLAGLFPETRWLITEYSDPKRKGRDKVRHRENLAHMLGISVAQLRSRIFRIREELLNRLNECLARTPE
jgi:hypothetical protein